MTEMDGRVVSGYLRKWAFFFVRAPVRQIPRHYSTPPPVSALPRTMASHVLATDARSLPASVVSAAAAAYGLDPEVVLVLTRVAADGNLGEPAGSVAKLVSLASSPGFHTPAVLAALHEAVMPGGEIVVGVLGAAATSSVPVSSAPAAEKDLLVAGFADARAAAGDVAGVAPGAVAASKPTWTAGASFSLKSRRLKENAAPPNNNGAAKAWKLGDDDDLVDEDDLLDDADLRSGADAASKARDAGEGCGPKACKNCSCGRAEVEAEEEAGKRAAMTEEKKEEFKSSCGNCYLGDAYRCAGCPMLGQPAQAPPGSTTVKLDLTSDI